MRKELTFTVFLRVMAGYVLFFAGVILAAPLFGAETLDPRLVLDGFSGQGAVDAHIFFQQRLPRVLLGACAGGGLALVGAIFQTVFRNPLAEPFTLGITGGAVVGAVAAISIPGLWISWGPFSTVQIFALLGSGFTLSFLYVISRKPEGMSTNTLLLAGITVNIFSSGIILFFRYMVTPNLLVEIDRWLMGGIDIIGYNGLSTMLPFFLPAVWMLFPLGHALNTIVLGEELAMGYGVDVKSIHIKSFVGGGLLTAAVVSLAGPIGFVGLVVPHIVRRISGYDHRIVLPASFLTGGAFLVACDTLARTIIAPTEMPVGIITAIIGAPIFIRLLFKNQ